MKIKDYKCKCGNADFITITDNDERIGIYCSYCGKWFKWADKNEKNLIRYYECMVNDVKGVIQ